MARIVFSMYPEDGHLNPTYRIARGLRKRGHEVTYLALADCRAAVESRGFELQPLFEDLQPEGALAEERERLRRAGGGGAAIRELRRAAARQRAVAARWRDGSGEELLHRLAPDIVLADTMEPMLALVARAAGLPHLLLNTTLPYVREPGVPPANRFLVPEADGRNGWRIRRAWWSSNAERRLMRSWRGLLGADPGLDRQLRLLARHTGFPVSQIQTQSPFFPMPKLPELVLCPRELDFPRRPVAGRTFVEASVDDERSEPDFPWEWLDPERRLVVLSLGSQMHRLRSGRGIFQAFVQAVRDRADLQLVLAAGSQRAVEELGDLPSNVLAVRWIPQLGLLARASLMVTHGGLGTVKECILHGVPMLVLPMLREQPGNASRVRFHGLGEVLAPEELVRTDLAGVLGRLLDHREVAEKVAAMRSVFRSLEENQPSLHRIEERLVTQSSPR